jgi:hypothetical protein
MRLKSAISRMLVPALGLCVGSAAAGGGIGPNKLHYGPAIMTLDHNWNITGIVTPDHHSNMRGVDTNNMLLRNSRLGGKGPRCQRAASVLPRDPGGTSCSAGSWG